jgi:hypothetical protein
LTVPLRGEWNDSSSLVSLESSVSYQKCEALENERHLLLVPYCYPPPLQYVSRIFEELHKEEIVSLELTIALMLHAHGLTRSKEGGSTVRMAGITESCLHHHTIPSTPTRPLSCAGKNHLLFPMVQSQVSHNIIMSFRRVKLSLPNTLPHVVETCGRIGEGGV